MASMQRSLGLIMFALFSATTAHPVVPDHKLQQFTKDLRHDLKVDPKVNNAVAGEKKFKSGKTAHSEGAKSVKKPEAKPVVQPAAKPASVTTMAVKGGHSESGRAASKPVARPVAKPSIMSARKLQQFSKDLRRDLSKMNPKSNAMAVEKMPKSGKLEQSVKKPVVQSTSKQPSSGVPSKAVKVVQVAKPSSVVPTKSATVSEKKSTPEKISHDEKATSAARPQATPVSAGIPTAHAQDSANRKLQNTAVKPAAKLEEHVAKASEVAKPVAKSSMTSAPSLKSAHPSARAAVATPVAAVAHTSSKQTVNAVKSAHGGAQPSAGSSPAAKSAVKISGTKSNPFNFATNFLRKQADACQCQFKGICTCDSTMEFMDCITKACASGKCDCHALQYQHACVDIAGTCNTLGFECKAEKAVCVSKLESDRHDIKPKPKTSAEIYEELRKLKEDKCRFEMAKEDGWLNSQTQLTITEKEITSRLADLVERGDKQPEMHCGKHFDEHTLGLESKGCAVRGGPLLLVLMAFLAFRS